LKTSVIYITGMMSVLDALGVEKRLRRHPSIVRVEANFLSGTSTVEYDDDQITLADLQELVSECGYYCPGECLPENLCKPAYAPRNGESSSKRRIKQALRNSKQHRSQSQD
jgi:P-type Cu2+ transporter